MFNSNQPGLKIRRLKRKQRSLEGERGMKPGPVHTVQAGFARVKSPWVLSYGAKCTPSWPMTFSDTDSIYIVVIPSGDTLEKYGFGH